MHGSRQMGFKRPSPVLVCCAIYLRLNNRNEFIVDNSRCKSLTEFDFSQKTEQSNPDQHS